ncbi:MAG: S-adenosylmethionine:tRNA ribosyltransferase-isomerase, partial [Actinobacteria bacterium]|nr:S-adenosylmethionine:tRNA ribosyltransferase-isomerase [Actinomycetota bacterium]
MSIKPEHCLQNYLYELGKGFIAQKPLEKREISKMLVLDKKSGSIVHDFFY